MSFRKALTAAALTLGLLSASALSASPAFADSYKIAYFGDIKIGDLEIGQGQLASEVTGHGTRIDTAGGDFVSAGTICQWQILIRLIDASGNVIDEEGDGRSDCSMVGLKKYNMGDLEMEDGSRIEVRLTSYGELVAKTVHDIEDYKPWYKPW